LRAFFANTVAATQAVDFPVNSGGKPVHYLRTTNPLNPEVLAVYPHRLGSNRTNPYTKPGGLLDLNTGLLSFETRHCGNPQVPVLGDTPAGGLLAQLLPPALKSLIVGFVFGTENNPSKAGLAPPCKKQSKYTFNGRTTEYPQVTADPPGR